MMIEHFRNWLSHIFVSYMFSAFSEAKTCLVSDELIG